jgi:hypothetical protein
MEKKKERTFKLPLSKLDKNFFKSFSFLLLKVKTNARNIATSKMIPLSTKSRRLELAPPVQDLHVCDCEW